MIKMFKICAFHYDTNDWSIRILFTMDEKKSKSLSGRYIQGNHIESQSCKMDDVTRDL